MYTCHCSVCSNACLPATLSNQDRELCEEAVLFILEKLAKSCEVGYNNASVIYLCFRMQFYSLEVHPKMRIRYSTLMPMETEVDGDVFQNGSTELGSASIDTRMSR